MQALCTYRCQNGQNAFPLGGCPQIGPLSFSTAAGFGGAPARRVTQKRHCRFFLSPTGMPGLRKSCGYWCFVPYCLNLGIRAALSPSLAVNVVYEFPSLLSTWVLCCCHQCHQLPRVIIILEFQRLFLCTFLIPSFLSLSL